MAEPKVLQGTLDLLVMTAVAVAPAHGYGIGQWILRNTDGDLEIDEGALYHALHRLARKGLLDAEWRPSDTGRRAKFYSLTEEGVEHLAREEAQWETYSGLVGRLMDAGRAESVG
jgi:transcriptional regulator